MSLEEEKQVRVILGDLHNLLESPLPTKPKRKNLLAQAIKFLENKYEIPFCEFGLEKIKDDDDF